MQADGQQQQQWMMQGIPVVQGNNMQQQQQQQPGIPPTMAPHVQPQAQGQDEVRSLWVGDLQYWMDEHYLCFCFGMTGECVSAKVIKNKQTSQPEGYGFVEFRSHAAAEQALQNYNGAIMPRTDQLFRLNWASFGIGDRRDSGPDHSIFVGDLATDVTDVLLLETFKNRYPSVKGAKVVIDANTSRSKGYGFVRFGDDAEKTRAMNEMNGEYCSSRPMRISTATPKKALGNQQVAQKASFSMMTPFGGSLSQASTTDDPTNTTIFVGGLDESIGEDDLRQVFLQSGEITSIKIPPGKGCGFVQFKTRASAEEALQKFHGSTIGQNTIRLSWRRNPANKQRESPQLWNQMQPEMNHWNNGSFYAYNQGYDGYGYPIHHHHHHLQDPSAYPYGPYPATYGAPYPQQVS